MSNEGDTERGGPVAPVLSRNGLLAIAGGVLLALGTAYILFGGPGDDILSGTTFIAKRGDLDITVTEGGSIEAIESQEIRSQIKGHAGVKILTIIEEGYLVTYEDIDAGMVLVQLDSADLEDKRVNQEIAYQSAQAQFIEKRAQYDIQVNQNQSNISAAELASKFALMDFEKFLGKKAVDSIVENLKLDEKAAELKKLKAMGGIIQEPPLPAPAASASMSKGIREGPAWGGGSSTERSGRPSGMRRAEGGAAPEGQRRFGGQRGGFGSEGGGMNPERFRQMMEANGGKIPEAMADRLREMGMDPDTLMQQMGGAPPAAGADDSERQAVVQKLEYSSSRIKAKTAFTNEPAYVKERDAIDFASYADVDQLEDGQAKQRLRQLEDELLVAREDHRLAERLLIGQERLAEKGHITQNTLDLERVKVEKARIRRELAQMEQHLYIQYTFQKEGERLLSDFEEALMNLERTMQEAGAKLAQAEVGFKTAEQKFNLEARQLEDLKDQIAKCTIRAERTGLVVYGSSTGHNPFRRSNEEPIQEGTTVRQRQKIITIPDMTRMGVTVNIHESSVQKVAKGQPVTMTIDAFPDLRLTGAVERVAILADSANMFMNPDLKVYPTMVRIDGVHDWLRPGMSAEVVILIDKLEDVVYIPIQAVSYFGDDQVCFVVKNGKALRRIIDTGSFTQEYIEVRDGLEEGEEVLLLAPNVGEQGDLFKDKDADTDEEETGQPAPEEVRAT